MKRFISLLINLLVIAALLSPASAVAAPPPPTPEPPPIDPLQRQAIEQAVVLDGMPGQDFQRRLYVVHKQTLYILAFTPTRSENKAAGDQMEALYDAVTSSWAWSPCSASK